jgi:hypothetical protein
MDIGAMAGHPRPNNIMGIARSVVKGVLYDATHMRLLGDVSKEKGGGWHVRARAGGAAAAAASSEDEYDKEDSEQEAGMRVILGWLLPPFGCRLPILAPLLVLIRLPPRSFG